MGAARASFNPLILLQLDGRSGGLELLLDLLCLVLGHAFLDRFRRAFDEVLGLLQAPASKIARTLNEPGAQLARVFAAFGKKEAA